MIKLPEISTEAMLTFALLGEASGSATKQFALKLAEERPNLTELVIEMGKTVNSPEKAVITFFTILHILNLELEWQAFPKEANNEPASD